MAQIKKQKQAPRTSTPKATPLAPARNTPAPRATTMPYKPSGSKPKAEVMPYKPSTRGGTSAGPAPSGPGRSTPSRVPREQERGPTMDDKVYRTMPITEQQLKKIKTMYGIE